MHEHEKRFDPKEAHRLEDPERLKFLPPAEIVSALQLVDGLTVADMGAGTGYFAVPIARAVGSGKVMAVDVSDELLELLREKLRRGDAPGNIVLLQGDAEGTSLRRESCDLVFMANVWHEFPHRVEVLLEAKRLLRPNGRVAILDWKPGTTRPPGPPLEHRVPQCEVERILTAEGWRDVRGREIGQHSYLIIATRP